MRGLGIRFWLCMSVLAGLILGCVYLAFLGIRAGDEAGPWLFGAFGVLFGLPFLAGILRITSVKSPRVKRFYNKVTGADRPDVIRFVPHRFMMISLVIIGLVLLYGFVTCNPSL
ncbi:MAG: hypothetical protein PHT95_08300 [Candidatus Omnitrophica bacterium]|nr:hypothetical protein [Candidatus Omnitrophota bacterium]